MYVYGKKASDAISGKERGREGSQDASSERFSRESIDRFGDVEIFSATRVERMSRKDGRNRGLFANY